MSSQSSIFLIVSLLIALLIVNCKDEILYTEPTANIWQVSKCNGQGLKKSSEECFEYIFTNSLEIKFCVSGNCCPDSARFVSNYKIDGEIITIFVKDIAPNLCKCYCTYTIQASFSNLLLDSYKAFCYQEIESGNKQLYMHSVLKRGKQ